jgi:hypothetical protein
VNNMQMPHLQIKISWIDIAVYKCQAVIIIFVFSVLIVGVPGDIMLIRKNKQGCIYVYKCQAVIITSHYVAHVLIPSSRI